MYLQQRAPQKQTLFSAYIRDSGVWVCINDTQSKLPLDQTYNQPEKHSIT